MQGVKWGRYDAGVQVECQSVRTKHVEFLGKFVRAKYRSNVPGLCLCIVGEEGS